MTIWGGVGQLTLALLSTQATTEILKRTIQEKRPNYKEGDKKHSFPSGHAAGAFSGATYIHKRYGLEQALLPYALATFVAYSRVDARKHYIHDVAMGAGIAALWTWVFVDEKEEPKVALNYVKDGLMLSYKSKF
ncbi:phosphatase PAP2 family protein [Campylobacter gastrosuis]|uniref:Phosphatase PAP2 family protein n=1 Tax=Campylobacter gastrosuis TaxID=2974576 RepID=A0ABT7HS10_9BACT|nr:phosphatase PAP2 family protein [Campylobacter gastrosuis]MDL0089665.1 phosphatase PAP2 family protein [Campylobacter gastrosuis]